MKFWKELSEESLVLIRMAHVYDPVAVATNWGKGVNGFVFSKIAYISPKRTKFVLEDGTVLAYGQLSRLYHDTPFRREVQRLIVERWRSQVH